MEIRTIKSADRPPVCMQTIELENLTQPPEAPTCPRPVTNTREMSLLYDIMHHETICGDAHCTQPSCRVSELQTRTLSKLTPGKMRNCKCCCIQHCAQFNHVTDSELTPYKDVNQDLWLEIVYNSFPNYYKYCKHLPLCCATISPPVVVSNLLRSTTKLIALNSTQPKVTNFFHIFETGVCLINRSIWTYENTAGSENLTLLTAILTVRGSK